MQAHKFKRNLIALAVVGAFGIGAITAERAGMFKDAAAEATSPATVAVELAAAVACLKVPARSAVTAPMPNAPTTASAMRVRLNLYVCIECLLVE